MLELSPAEMPIMLQSHTPSLEHAKPQTQQATDNTNTVPNLPKHSPTQTLLKANNVTGHILPLCAWCTFLPRDFGALQLFNACI